MYEKKEEKKKLKPKNHKHHMQKQLPTEKENQEKKNRQ